MTEREPEDQAGDYVVIVATSGRGTLTWQGYADNPYAALMSASLALETGDGPGEWGSDDD